METKEIIKSECNLDTDISAETKKNTHILNKQKRVIIAILFTTMLISIFVAPFIVDKLHIIEKTGETLDSKKNTVVVVTATAATASIALAAVPEDIMTPLANQIAELDIFFIIVLTAIYLLKVLLIISTTLSFKLLFPLACLFGAAYYMSNNNYLKTLALKILALGLVVFLTVPISVATMNIVDTALNTQEKVETVTTEETNSFEVNERINTEKSWWNNLLDTAKNVVKDVGNFAKEVLELAKNKFNELVDIVASLIITCCIIPLAVMLFLAWILKVLFGINIPIKKVYKRTHSVLKNTLTNKSNQAENEI